MEALVVIDMQNYFISDSLKESSPGIKQPISIIPSIACCLKEARNLNLPIIHIKTEYKADKSDWPKSKSHRDSLYCIENTQDAEFISELCPLPDEAVIVKSRYSGFYDTEFEAWLKENGIQSIALAGYALDCCVRFTAVDAFNIGYGTTILRDCVMSSWEDTDVSIEYLQYLIQSEVSDSKDWLSQYHA